MKGDNEGKRNISVPSGKENNSDSLSSGERKGNSLNHFSVMPVSLAKWCCGDKS